MTRLLLPLQLRSNINCYLLNVLLHNRRQFSVEMFQSGYWQQNCKGHCDSMLGSLSSVELVKIFIILLSEDSKKNKLGIT